MEGEGGGGKGGGYDDRGGGGYNLRASAHRFGPPTVAYLALLVNQKLLLFVISRRC